MRLRSAAPFSRELLACNSLLISRHTLLRRNLSLAAIDSQSAHLAAASSIPPSNIRNFAIIAHVDHGKSTLADRLMSITGAVPEHLGRPQMLDNLDIERERGITIKAQTVSLFHRCQKSGELFLLNLIDTPGHVDFSYEVSRSLAACQGALLLVDCVKGVQAQTVANFFLAFEQSLSIVPVVNKVDLPHAQVEGTLAQMRDAFDMPVDEALRISAKTGAGCDALLPALLERIPPPRARADEPLRLLLFDSWYDDFLGVLCLIEVLGGTLQLGAPLISAASGKRFTTQKLSLMRPLGMHDVDALGPGMVGCVSLGMKHIDDGQVCDPLPSLDDLHAISAYHGGALSSPHRWATRFRRPTTRSLRCPDSNGRSPWSSPVSSPHTSQASRICSMP